MLVLNSYACLTDHYGIPISSSGGPTQLERMYNIAV